MAQSLCLPASHTLPLHSLFILGLNLQLWHRLHCANAGRVSLHCLLRIALQKCGCCPDVCSCLILYFCLDLLISFLPLLFCLFYFLSQESCCFFGLWSLSFNCRASLSVCPDPGLHQAANRLSSWKLQLSITPKDNCGNIACDWEISLTPRFKKIFCGQYWPALLVSLKCYVLSGHLQGFLKFYLILFSWL